MKQMQKVLVRAALVAILLAQFLPAQYTRRRSVATATSGPYTGPAVSFNGTLKVITKKDMTVDLDPPDPDAERQTLTFRITKKTKFLKGDQPIKPTDIAAGAHISLDATREGDLKLTAVAVYAPAPAEKPPAK